KSYFCSIICNNLCFFFQAEDGIRDRNVTGVQTCALPICGRATERKRSCEEHDSATRPQTVTAAQTGMSIPNIFHSSSVVEQSAVNRSVVGSNPTCGAFFMLP